jgi:hypothetical protein
MSMKRFTLIASAAAIIAVSPGTSCFAASENPIFGKLSVEKLTPAENMKVVGKGYYADLNGYYGNYYAALASQYGSVGFYFKNYSSYSTAGTYAGYAATYFNYAASYQSTNR